MLLFLLLKEEEEDDVEAVTAQSCKCFSPCSSNNSEKRLLFPLRAGDDVLPNEDGDLRMLPPLKRDGDDSGKSPPSPPKLLLLPTESMAMPDVKDEVVL